MSDFLEAYKEVRKNEGGYAFVDGDTGLMTYMGISRKHFPKWQGWAIVDSHLPLEHNEVIDSVELLGMVKNFYRVNFWNPISGDEIESQELANQMFDMAINAGTSAAIKLAQRVAGIKETGIMTMAVLNEINGIA